MPLSLIQSLAPALLVLALVVPAVTGFLGKRLRVSVALGWGLFVLAYLFQDAFSLLLAQHFHGREGVRAVAVDQPGTVAALFFGWFYPLPCHGLGFLIAKLTKRR